MGLKMIIVNSVDWGKIWVDGKEYREVLIVGDKVFEREHEKLKQLFGTGHQIGDWETEILLSNRPEVIVIGNGWDGVLEVNEKIKNKIEKIGMELKILKTPQAAEEFNRLSEAGKKVNALIHTTC